MKNRSWRLLVSRIGVLTAGCLLALSPATVRAESQSFKGGGDPFEDPTDHEFQGDEREDKAFFHLRRDLMFGIDLGAGFFTGGLGASNAPAFLSGAHLVYFFDRQLAIEAGAHYANDVDTISANLNQTGRLNTDLIPITLAFRFYFDTRNAPKAIAIANPYLVGGGGIYLRNQTVIDNLNNALPLPSGSTASFGALAGAGVEFAIYGEHLYLGADFRYHFVFWPDRGDTMKNALPDGARNGGWISAVATLTYSF